MKLSFCRGKPPGSSIMLIFYHVAKRSRACDKIRLFWDGLGTPVTKSRWVWVKYCDFILWGNSLHKLIDSSDMFPSLCEWNEERKNIVIVTKHPNAFKNAVLHPVADTTIRYHQHQPVMYFSCLNGISEKINAFCVGFIPHLVQGPLLKAHSVLGWWLFDRWFRNHQV